jgi:amino acid adenylation domain-containing protein
MLTDAQRAALTARLSRGRVAMVDEIPRRNPARTGLPLSFGQEQLWFLDRLAPGLAAYNVPIAIRLSGPLDVTALGRAIDMVVARHEALRSRLRLDDSGRPVQVIISPEPVPLKIADLLDPDPGWPRVREFVDAEALRPFDLAGEPLLRACLLRVADGKHVLLVVVHHAVFDGWSARLLTSELAAFYGQASAGEPLGLAELPVQFADYALWERDRLQTGKLGRLEDYWRATMNGFETLQFPADRPRPLRDSFAGARVQHTAGLDLLASLRELSRAEGTTLFVTLMAAFQALLHRYTGQTDLVVGTVSANRGRAELDPLIGFLVNTLPIRCDLSGNPAFRDLLSRVREAVTGAYAHQGLPFGTLVETLRVERDASRAPVFQIAMTFAEREVVPRRSAGVDFVLTDLAVGIDAAKFDLDLLVEARSGGLWFEATYAPALFEAGTIERLLHHLEVLLRAVVRDPSTPLSALAVLTETDLRRELTEWNDTAAGSPATCVHEVFEAQVRRDPDAVAAQYEGKSWSYAKLNSRANQIARRLRGAGAGPDVLVGVCLPAGLHRLAALLAVWKAGAGYVPLDPGLPVERLRFMADDTSTPVIVTDTATAENLPVTVTRVCLDAEWISISELDDTDLAAGQAGTGVRPDNTAYVIYTSGSTGEPKGVVVEHRQAANFLCGTARRWDVGPSDVVLQFGSFTFDASVLDTFLPLLAGARVTLASAQTLHSPRRLAALMRDARVTFALLPPAVLSLLAGERFPTLRVLMTGGEELPSEVARPWVRPGLRFVNAYGPTETAVIATCQELDASMVPPPIGRPNWPNYQAYVLDPELNPVPPGVLGELYIGGAGVARGYLNRPGLTAQRFIPDPFRPGPGTRLYKTGDLVRRRPDGTIVFAGRADDQVKIRGLRVELGEIEAALSAHPSVAQAVVTVFADPAGDRQLAGYLRMGAEAGEGPADVREHLAARLPGYMIPAYLTVVDAFPLNASGKIDKSALPVPRIAGDDDDRAGPATLVEAVLADLYATVLGHDRARVTDSFFDVGGNSLQAMRLITMLQDELAVDVDIASVFLAPTPRQLAALLRDKHGLEDDELGAEGVAGLQLASGAPDGPW